jgi:hypothetical protein
MVAPQGHLPAGNRPNKVQYHPWAEGFRNPLHGIPGQYVWHCPLRGIYPGARSLEDRDRPG